MDEPILSEIYLFAFGFAPRHFAQCNGQLLPIDQNLGLYSLLGTTYGGDGRVTFALPDLRGRVAIGESVGHTLGERGGQENVTLTAAETAHTHSVGANRTQNDATTNDPSGAKYFGHSPISQYSTGVAGGATLNASAVTNTGGGQAHNNMQPFLTLNFCIALLGLFPSQD